MSGYKKALFHISTGPDALFRRVRQKINSYRVLPAPSKSLTKRWVERGIPVGELRGFNPDDWQLMTATVRADRGKFVTTAWRRPFQGAWLWVVIGLNDSIEKAMFKQGEGRSDDVITDGELFDFVAEVNEELASSESWRDEWEEIAEDGH